MGGDERGHRPNPYSGKSTSWGAVMSEIIPGAIDALAPPDARLAGRKLRMLLCCAGAPFLIMLDTNIVAVSLPSIARDLHGAFTDVEWVVSAYILPFTALLMPAGAFGRPVGPTAHAAAGAVDLYGRITALRLGSKPWRAECGARVAGGWCGAAVECRACGDHPWFPTWRARPGLRRPGNGHGIGAIVGTGRGRAS